jgi:uncharacterized membrane protein YkvA (DUF1232 family)
MKPEKIIEILKPENEDGQKHQRDKIRTEFWSKLKKTAKHIPFIEELVAGYYCALDKDTPLKVRGTLLAALVYFILPFDVVPDFLLGIGYGDDLAVLMAALTQVKAHIKDSHRQAAYEALDDSPDIS